MDKGMIECTISFFAYLEMKGQKEVLNWCMNAGLITSRYECPKCGENMRLCERKGIVDGYEWRCRNKGDGNSHDVCRSVRKGSFFSHSHLSMCDILRVTRFWFGRCMHEFVMNELKMNSHTVVDWYMFCREVCMMDLINKSVRIGGKGVIVEVVESKFEKIKYGKSKLITGTWMFCGVERGTSKCFFKPVEFRTKEEFFTVIKDLVLPGSIVISDCWKVYECLSDEEFSLLRIINDLTFKDSETSTCSNSFEGIWSVVKHFFRYKKNLDEGEFDSYLGEYMWRKMHNHSMSVDAFKLFLQAIVKLYQPLEKDPLANSMNSSK